MNLQAMKRGKQKSVVSFRIPNEIRDKVQAIAKKQSTGDVQVTESDVYREIVTSFFSQERIENLYESEAQPS